uniref:Uncharacterized protein n=1 Tax=Amphimedon queenslandica TaxID=400682 RepID=A0A1X7VUZ0_AMPQE
MADELKDNNEWKEQTLVENMRCFDAEYDIHDGNDNNNYKNNQDMKEKVKVNVDTDGRYLMGDHVEKLHDLLDDSVQKEARQQLLAKKQCIADIGIPLYNKPEAEATKRNESLFVEVSVGHQSIMKCKVILQGKIN